MKEVQLSVEDARRLVLQAQKLEQPPRGSARLKTDALIEHLGYIQIDTISVVERAHHHVLWSRIPSYRPGLLDSLVESKRVFEYWSHAAAYLPMKDYRFTLMRKQAYRKKRNSFPDKVLLKRVLDRIRAEGELRSADFEKHDGPKQWWHWKPAKHALEHLFHSGDLMVSARRNFQKVYDLTERVLPSETNTTTPSHKEFSSHLLHQHLRSCVFVTASECSYLRGGEVKKNVHTLMTSMLQSGELVRVQLEGIPGTWYTSSELLSMGASGPTSRTVLLSPFDNMVIQRKRLKALFDFDYVIECYVPEPKRVHGYFCLPILHNGKFIGRVDCKAERAAGVLRVCSLYVESELNDGEASDVRIALGDFASFNGCQSVEFDRVIPRSAKRLFR